MANAKIPIQASQWTEFLSCPVCNNIFNDAQQRPISLGCGHTVCKGCLSMLQQKKCPFDQSTISRDIDELPVNIALLQLVGAAVPEMENISEKDCGAADLKFYNSAQHCIEEIAMFLKPLPSQASTGTPALSRPMQRKVMTLVNCQLIEEEGRIRAMRAARSLGERSVTELILQHQNPQQLSANLWAAVRARGCQFLGPAMQEEVLKLILLALEDGSALSRKVLVLFVVQRLESLYPQASKTAIGHVVQLLYRASCFKVTKREEESSLMQLKEEFRTYEALRREHDSQIVQIATEAGLRISPDQWSSLLYGDTAHKSHMQSIIDKLQNPQSFGQSVSELVIALQRSGDPGNLSRLRAHFDLLANIDPSPESMSPSWENLDAVMKAARAVVEGLVEFIDTRTHRKPEPLPLHNTKYKTSLCRDLTQKGSCPRGANCTFAHSAEELDRYRARNKKIGTSAARTASTTKMVTSSALSPLEKVELAAITKSTQARLQKGTLESVSSTPKATVSPRVQSPSSSGQQSCVSTSSTVILPDGKQRKIIMQDVSKGVHVPVVKPQMLQGKALRTSHTIYTCPTPVLEEGSPSTVPITQCAPRALEVVKDYDAEGTYPPRPPSQQSPDLAPHTHQASRIPTSVTTPVMQVEPRLMNTCNFRGKIPPGRQAGSPANRIIMADEVFMKSTVTMPLNPYTTERFPLPTRDSHHYLTTNIGMQTRGKMPSQQLSELQQRRCELRDKLNRQAHPEDDGGAQDNSPVPPIGPQLRMIGPTQSVFTSYEQSHMGQSVADSMATSLSTMSLAKHDLDPYKVLNSTVAPASSYIPWSDGEVISGSFSMYDTPSESEASYEEDEELTTLSLTTGSSFPQYGLNSLHMDSPSPPYPSYSGLSSNQEDPGDEFIPFEHTMVSKYGPISRMAKTKMKNTLPVQVTAAQVKDTTPVTAITPLRSGYPISAQVPSRFPPHAVRMAHSDHIADPMGVHVASSLPTALMQPNVIAAANKTSSPPSTLWTLRKKVLNMTDGNKSSSSSMEEREQMQQELERLDYQIENLQMSEDERLARELQAIELNIQEKERQLHMNTNAGEVAKILQQDEEQKQKKWKVAKQKQEEMDRKFAEKLVLDEARAKGIRIVPGSNLTG